MTIHVTPIPKLTAFDTPAFTLGTSNAAGDALTAVASNSTLLAFDATLPASIAFGQSGSAGSATVTARRDHTHPVADLQTVVWAQIQADGSSLDSYNVASTAKNSTGIYTVTIDNDLANTGYAGATCSNSGNTMIVNINTIGTGSYRTEITSPDETASNSAHATIICGELA